MIAHQGMALMGMCRMLKSERAIKTVPSESIWPAAPATENTAAVTKPGELIHRLGTGVNYKIDTEKRNAQGGQAFENSHSLNPAHFINTNARDTIQEGTLPCKGLDKANALKNRQ